MHLQRLGFHPVQCATETQSIDEIVAAFVVDDDSKPATMDKAHGCCCALQRIEEDVRDLVDDVVGLRLSGFLRPGVEWAPDFVGGTLRYHFVGGVSLIRD